MSHTTGANCAVQIVADEVAASVVELVAVVAAAPAVAARSVSVKGQYA